MTAFTVLALPVAATADQTITSAGPLTSIGISSQLNCSVHHAGDSAGEFYGETACGTLVASGGTLYGPSSIPAGGGASPRTAYTEVSQTAVTGSGTSGDPYKIVTVVDLGTSGLRLTETDSYVVGDESYRTDVRLHNSGNADATANIYRAGDCYLQNSDSGFGSVDTTSGAVACVSAEYDPNTGTYHPGSRIEQWLPLSSGSHYYQSFYSSVWAAIGSQQPFNDTCSCDSNIDNGAGLSWTATVPAGGDVTRSSLITFSPLGHQPLTTSKTADSDTATAGGSDGYTITIRNPNTQAVTLSAITDTLPAGFSYTAGSTTGATTGNPTVNGQDLTWAGPFTVPAAVDDVAGTLTLHFGVTVSGTPGDYYNNAGGAADDYTVVPTGDTAKITVTAPAHQYALSLTPAGATNPVGTSHTVTATLTDHGSPVSGAALSFVVTGVNPTSGSGSTDGSGNASFTYTGTNVGNDTITACYDADTSGSCDGNDPQATATKTWTQVGDTRKPSCALTGSGVDANGKKYIEVTVRDTGSGLKTVVVSHSTNTVNSIPPFTQGTTSPVVVRATKINQSQGSTVEVTATDVAGNTTVCDPIIATLKGRGKSVTHRLKGIKPAERYVRFTNGRPGLRSVVLTVNGHRYHIGRLKAGQVVTFDIGRSLRVRHNKVTVTMRGSRRAGGLLVLHD